MPIMKLYEACLIITLDYWAGMAVACGTSIWAINRALNKKDNSDDDDGVVSFADASLRRAQARRGH
jgi:hypothetical protein